MRDDIRLRGLSQNTLVNYTLHARIFLEFSNRPVEQLDTIDIRNFLWHLINEKKASPATVNAYSAAIRFLFAVTLNRTLNYLQIPRQKIRKTLPEVLTRQEVFSIIENCKNLKHKAMLMIVYSSGLRVSEAARVKIQHIDSKNMRVFVDCGKGGKDRYTLLSKACLTVLREYWKEYPSETKLKMPVMAIGSKHFIAEEVHRQMQRVFDNVTCKILDCGHSLALERPQELADMLREFMK